MAGAEVQQGDARQAFKGRDLRVLFEEARGADREYLFGEEELRHVVRMLLQPQGHRGIEALLIVRVRVGADQVQLKLGMLDAQTLQPRQQPELGEGGGGDQGQVVLALAPQQVAGCRGDMVQGGGGRQEQRMPVAGELDLAVAALEQLQAVEVFQRLDLPADRRLGHAEFLRRQLETAMPGGGFESAQRIQWREQMPEVAHWAYLMSRTLRTVNQSATGNGSSWRGRITPQRSRAEAIGG
ncbi:hypothetical protein D3C76_1200420 [compost metagenome]